MSASDSQWRWAQEYFASRGYTLREVDTAVGRALYPGRIQDGLVVAPLGLLSRDGRWAALAARPCRDPEIVDFDGLREACEFIHEQAARQQR